MNALATNSRYQEMELAAIAGAKTLLKELPARWPTLDANAQVSAIQDATGALVILSLAEPVEAEARLKQFVTLSKLSLGVVRRAVNEGVAAYRVSTKPKLKRQRQQAPSDASGSGILILPSGTVTITETAEELYRRIAPSKSLFIRGGAVTSVVADQQGALTLQVLRPSAARSTFEQYGRLMAWRIGEGNEAVLKPVIMAEDMARALLESDSARKDLPCIVGLINCPIIIGDGEIVGTGYHAGTRLLVTGGSVPPVVELSEAVNAVLDVLSEFDFQTPGDKSRALAALLTPALKLGEHIRGNVPADVAEADRSQSGKTYRQKIVAAIYNERVAVVSCKSGGVGSVDESLNSQLAAGHPFIQLDNFRGEFNSPHTEALLTAEKSFPVRVPHCREIEIDPSRFFISLTSNGVETTPDFANRSNIIRNRRREGFVFRKYPEGDLLDHVRARQPYYLGCVFAIVKAWIEQGRQRTEETRHDFREWCQSLDWIVQNILHEAPLMDGHQSAQERVSNPDQTFLRKLALAVAEQGRLTESLIASELYEIADAAGVEIRGLQEPDEGKGKRQIGKVMARLFKQGEVVSIEDYEVHRQETQTHREEGGDYTAKTYTFRRTNSAQSAPSAQEPECSGKPPDFSGTIEPCAACASAETDDRLPDADVIQRWQSEAKTNGSETA